MQNFRVALVDVFYLVENIRFMKKQLVRLTPNSLVLLREHFILLVSLFMVIWFKLNTYDKNTHLNAVTSF